MIKLVSSRYIPGSCSVQTQVFYDDDVFIKVDEKFTLLIDGKKKYKMKMSPEKKEYRAIYNYGGKRGEREVKVTEYVMKVEDNNELTMYKISDEIEFLSHVVYKGAEFRLRKK